MHFEVNADSRELRLGKAWVFTNLFCVEIKLNYYPRERVINRRRDREIGRVIVKPVHYFTLACIMTGFVAWKSFFLSRNCTFGESFTGLEFLKRSTLLASALRHPGFKIWYFSNGPGVWTWWHVIANNNTARAAADDYSSAVNDEILKNLLLIWIFRMFREDASSFDLL